MRRITSFVERFDGYQGVSLQPTLEEIYGNTDKNSELDEEFIPMMLKIVSYISEHKNKTLSLNTLNKLAGNKLIAKYELITNNLYKSPRKMVIAMRLEKAEELLRSTDISVEQVAGECGFASPSYFIACFFNKHRKTPSEYRDES
jgi:transcriptional regulator GlxA family with amidase domain